MHRRVLLALLCLALPACAAVAARQSPAPPTAADARQQILLTLRIPPRHFHPDADYTGDYVIAPGRVARRHVAEQLARRYHLMLLDDWPIPALKLDCFVMQVPDGPSTRLLQQLAADPRVASVQPMHLFRALARHDPLYVLQPMAARGHLAELQQRSTGRHVTLAELDSGVELVHPDLRDQRVAARNFVGEGAYPAEAHGTEVAGIIVAGADNGIGIAGIAPGAHLLALRACWQEASGGALCSSFTLARALQFALDANAQVINLSLGGPRDPLLAQLLDVALARRITVVAAADPALADGGFPASLPGVLAVAGDDAGHLPAGVLRMPDRDIPTTLPGDRWGFVSGSSFAAAQVSGLVALLRELLPRVQPAQLRAALAPETALGSPVQRPAMIDACAAAMRVGGRCACDCAASNIALPRSHP